MLLSFKSVFNSFTDGPDAISEGLPSITSDIISNVCKLKKDKPKMIIGFAAETEKLIQNATKKLKNKRCSWIIANQITKKEKIFGSDYNKVVIIKPDKIIKFKRMTKINLAKKIVENIFEELKVN